LLPAGDIGEFDGVQGVFEACLFVICNFAAAPIYLMGAFYDFTISNDSNSYGSNRFEIAKQTGTNNIATDVLTNNICLLNNVVQDEIKIKILSSEKINYTLVDFKGAIVSNGILYQGDQIIDMFTNASGIYTLALSDQKDRVVYKIIKQ
jgi:hypothetical protein